MREALKLLSILTCYAALPRRTYAASRTLYSLLLTAFTLLALPACKSPNPNSPTSPNSAAPSTPTSPKDTISQLHVITVPVALDLDGRPGPDGIAVKLYANNANDPKAIRIREGTLEILMFDGTFHNRTNSPPILRASTFTGPDLRRHESKSNIGYGYEFTLSWGTNLPTQRLISVGARYTPSSGRPLVSRTSSVTVLNK